MAARQSTTSLGSPVSSDDWSRHRDRIVHLYIDENKPLKKVRQIMMDERGFNATYVIFSVLGVQLLICRRERMYKIRFTEWGVRKYCKSQEMSEVEDEIRRRTEIRISRTMASNSTSPRSSDGDSERIWKESQRAPA